MGIRRKLWLERLSARALLAGVTAEVLDGIAMVSGSAANDEIVIAPMTQRDEVHVFADGECISAWRRSDVREIDVQSFAGDDLVRVADSVAFPVKVTGGVGQDTVLIDHPHDHRHGWLFDVEQIMAEGEFTGTSAVGQGDQANHAGHDMSHDSSPVKLFPIPSDHLHVELNSAASQVETSVVHEHDAMAETLVEFGHDTMTAPSITHEHDMSTDTSAINTGMPDLGEAMSSPPDAAVSSPHDASQAGPAGGIESVADGNATSSTLAVTSLGSGVDHSKHAGYNVFTFSTGALAVDHSGHAGHGASAGSTVAPGLDHSGHAGHGVSTVAAGTDHAAHLNGTIAAGHEHGGDTTSAIHLDRAAGIEELSSIEPGTATAHKSGHHGHATGDSMALHGMTGHDHAGRWGAGSAAFASLKADAHSGHQCEGTHGTTPSASGGDGTERLVPPDALSLGSPVPDCHASKGAPKTDAVVDESNTASREQKDAGAAREAQTEDRPTTMRSHFAPLLAAAGTLLFICAVRPWRAFALPNAPDNEQAPRFDLEWLEGRGAANA